MDRVSASLRGLAAFAVVCAFACLAAGNANAAPLLWAVNSSTGSVSTLEGATGREVGLPIKTGDDPDSVAITPNGKRAYVANSVGESVTVIDAGIRVPIATIEVPGPAEQVAISPDGTNAYVTTGSGEEVAVINTGTNTIERTIPLGAPTSVVAAGVVAPFGGAPDEFAYVGLGIEKVQAINPGRGGLVNPPIDVGGTPRAISFSPDGKTAYVAAGNEVDVLEGGAVVKEITLGSEASGLAVSPDGTRVYVTSGPAKTVQAIDTATNKLTGTPMAVTGEPEEIALTANGRTAYVGSGEWITPVNLITRQPGIPVARVGQGAFDLVVAPDQPPTAAFNPPEATVGVPVTLSGAPSTDPDSSIATYQWFTDYGISPTGVTFTHTFTIVDDYSTTLTVTDDEGCGVAPVFTGRTVYCNGSSVASVTHQVPVKAAPTVCSARFAIGGVSHNRKNGTVRLRLRFPSTGSFLLFGQKIHAVTRKVRKPGSTVVTLHARVELNKLLKKTLRAQVRYRVTFTPSAGCGSKTAHRSVALLRAPRKPDHH
jgi:YVTN family beta-propeller protein